MGKVVQSKKRGLTNDAAFEEEKGVGVADIYFTFKEIDRKNGLLRWPAV